MKKYLLIMHENVEDLQKMSPNEMEELVNAHMDWSRQLAESGSLVTGDGLEETSVHISGKDCSIKEGMFTPSKEMIGGYYLLQGESLEDIIEIAKGCPCHLWGGRTEIRPIMDYE